MIYIIVFLVLRTLCEPERSPQLPDGFFSWIRAFWRLPDAYALRHQSLDSYLFIRFLRICCTICFVTLCVTWPILLPLNASGGNGKKQLDVFSYSNINIDDSTKRNRLYVHCFVACIVYSFVIYTITRECFFYINIRQAFLLTPQYTKRISSRTVLFTSVPKEYLDKGRIYSLFNGSAKNISIPGDTKELDRLIRERVKVAMKFEKGEVKWIKLCNKEHIKYEKKTGAKVEKVATATLDPGSGNLVAGWIPDDKRPTHCTGPLGLIGNKVDTIKWGREQLKVLIPKAQSAQTNWIAGDYEKHSAIFVEFATQYDAQLAFQAATHHRALQMAPRFIGIRPNEDIWKSLNYSWGQAAIRRFAMYATITGLIVLWAIPVTIVGVIAQVNIIKTLPGLAWIQNIPQVILGAVSGLLPSIALSLLMSSVPAFMRICARMSGCVSLPQAELFTQKAYFVFQVLQVFLVQTLSNSFVSSLVTILRNPTNVFSILSSSIPTASNFYISFFIVQGLTIVTNVLTQVIGFIICTLSFKFANRTPRSMYYKWTTLSTLSWVSLMPIYTNMAVISIVCSVIAPFLLLWSTIGTGLFYLSYRDNVLYVAEAEIDTRGLIYPQALKQLLSAKALNPLLYSIPLSLQFQENRVDRSQQQNEEDGQAQNGVGPTSTGASKSNLASRLVLRATRKGRKKAKSVFKWLKLWIYADYATVDQLVHHEDRKNLEQHQEAELHAYFPPSVTSQAPFLWVPADGDAGISKQEIFDTGKGCKLDDRNHIQWDTEEPRPPDWCEKINY
ncbi:Putative protein RSN1 [Fusarium odoratissimum]|uniref:Uncharacterized protein n=2 Tax=Fusarium oxysporum species complex TaxID=171631 RepID=N1S7X5_FUSC4|nr:Putative protein RSN1 [Fusarium odoratissimum]TXB97682.1 hypothetical protein FocTR4_00012257 [Fusarium oxysporum f. sp. cubense]